MAEDQEKKEEEKFEFTAEGEALGYISVDQAQVRAMQEARDNPGDYGQGFAGVRMVFDVSEQEESEDYYVVTLSYRPEGDFSGAPGQEQFFIAKEGSIAHRQVRSRPGAGGGRRFPLVPAAVGLGAVVVAAAIGVLFAAGVVGGGGSEPWQANRPLLEWRWPGQQAKAARSPNHPFSIGAGSACIVGGHHDGILGTFRPRRA